MSDKKAPIVLWLALLVSLCSSSLAVAQSVTATLGGTVTDEKGGVVPGATVTVINTQTNAQRQATTGNDGSFVVPLLPPSSYTVRIERDGFATAEIKEVALNVNDQRSLQIQLKVGQVGETVNVVSDSSIQESAAVGTVVNRQFVENLPLNGRSFQSLFELTPGTVVAKTTFQEQGQFSVNGQRTNANYVTIDGASANISINAGPLGQSGGGSLPGLSAAGGSNNLISVDALQEFRIQTSSYAAEFGRTPGAQVLIVTRPGTNKFSGALFEYFRNDALDATDFFANSRGQKKPALRQNDFGGVFSGPIIKDKTFFFFSYEGLRLRLPQVAVDYQVPDLCLRGTGTCVTGQSPAATSVRPLLAAFPIPNGSNFLDPAGNPTGLARFSSSYSDPSSLDATSIRIDHNLSSKLTLFGRYNHAPSSGNTRGGFRSLSTNTIARFKTQTFTGGATWIITPRISNDLRINWSRNQGRSFVTLDNFGGAVPPPDSMLFPVTGSPEKSFFLLFILPSAGSFSNSSFSKGKNTDNAQRQFNLIDNLSIVTGAHQLKFGVDYRALSPLNGPRESTLQAIYTVPGLRPPTTNPPTPPLPVQLVTGASDTLSLLFTNFSAYAQDVWKATPRLTLTYGLRWELNPPPKGRSGKALYTLNSLDNPTALAPAGTLLWQTTYNNFAPRFGFAYQLSNNPGRETVVRGGFGIFYDLGIGTIANSSGNFPYSRNKLIPGVTFPLTDPSLATPPPFSLNLPTNSFLAFSPNLKLPFTYQWNLALERSLGAKQTVSASYVAAVGRRLLRQDTTRFLPAGTPPMPPNVSTLLVTRNLATSDYHSFQLQFQRRLSRGLQALASYTWSHSLDNASNDSTTYAPLSKIDITGERGPSDFDVHHVFTAAVTYNIPAPKASSALDAVLGDWSVDTILRARSATPVDVLNLGIDILGVGAASRPDLVPGVPLYLKNPSFAGGKRINPAAFIRPTTSRQGTLGRNALRGFPASQLDLALRRQFNLTERVKLQFRSEFFNLFNHPNFADPINNLQDLLFGQSTQMLGRSLGSGGINGGFNPLYQIGGPRSIQLALKLLF